MKNKSVKMTYKSTSERKVPTADGIVPVNELLLSRIFVMSGKICTSGKGPENLLILRFLNGDTLEPITRYLPCLQVTQSGHKIQRGHFTDEMIRSEITSSLLDIE